MIFYYKYLFFSCFITIAFSSIQISGQVQDNDGSPLNNANVIIVNTSLGTQTNSEGNFIINLNKNDNCELQVSHIGYQKYNNTFDCNEDQYFTIRLVNSPLDFDETVVVVPDTVRLPPAVILPLSSIIPANSLFLVVIFLSYLIVLFIFLTWF